MRRFMKQKELVGTFEDECLLEYILIIVVFSLVIFFACSYVTNAAETKVNNQQDKEQCDRFAQNFLEACTSANFSVEYCRVESQNFFNLCAARVK